MNSYPVEYWMWLQNAIGAGAATDEILSYFETPKAMYEAGEYEWRLSGIFTAAKIEKLKQKSPKDFLRTVSECHSKGVKVLTPDNEKYPKQYKFLTDMPLVLYVLGDESSLLDHVHIAIVGTRKASAYGTEVTQRMSYSLAKAGVTIVSGGALGIDSEAHAGAMLAKGRTVCVLGCGIYCDYLKANAPLRRAITRYGAVISEYPIFAPASKITFPIRNRLISGLSLGVIVVEAGERSGSLITARVAAEQGKDVFAVPGDILRSSFTGTNMLIKDGVKAVFTPSDVLSEYSYEYSEYLNIKGIDDFFSSTKYINYQKKSGTKHKVNQAEKQPEKPFENKASLPQTASEDAKNIFTLLSENAIHIDEISEKASINIQKTLCALTELEMYGCARQIEGKRYVIINKKRL